MYVYENLDIIKRLMKKKKKNLDNYLSINMYIWNKLTSKCKTYHDDESFYRNVKTPYFLFFSLLFFFLFPSGLRKS